MGTHNIAQHLETVDIENWKCTKDSSTADTDCNVEITSKMSKNFDAQARLDLIEGLVAIIPTLRGVIHRTSTPFSRSDVQLNAQNRKQDELKFKMEQKFPHAHRICYYVPYLHV
jgi:hypothetical protein